MCNFVCQNGCTQRIRELETEVAELTRLNNDMADSGLTIGAMLVDKRVRDKLRTVEAKLRAAEKWPDKWIEIHGFEIKALDNRPEI